VHQQNFFSKIAPTDSSANPEVVSLDNPTKEDPSLILMKSNEAGTSIIPLFTHNCHIKHELATLIMDNGRQNNLISQDLVQHLQLPTTSHPTPYQLGWVQKCNPCLIVSRCCAVTFTIGLFHDTVTCDVSPVDCVDLLLGLPYQQTRHDIYHAKSHHYHFQLDGRTYVLTSSSPKPTLSLTDKATVKQVNINKCISLCLVHHVKPDNFSTPTPPDMLPLLKTFVDVFTKPTGLPMSRSIENSIDLIPGTSLPNAPSYYLTPQEASEIECQIG
jgi:hypothetical protein